MFWTVAIVIICIIILIFLVAMELSFRAEKSSYRNYVHTLIQQEYGEDIEIIKNTVSYDTSETTIVHEGNMYLLKTKERKIVENRKILWSIQMAKQ